MASTVVLDDWTCDWHSQAPGIAFQTFVQMYWCSSQHLCPLLLRRFGSFGRYVMKKFQGRGGQERRRNNVCNYTKLWVHIMGQRTKLKHDTSLPEHSVKTEPPMQLPQELLWPTRVENWWAGSKLKAQYFRHQDHPSSATFNILTELWIFFI